MKRFWVILFHTGRNIVSAMPGFAVNDPILYHHYSSQVDQRLRSGDRPLYSESVQSELGINHSTQRYGT